MGITKFIGYILLALLINSVIGLGAKAATITAANCSSSAVQTAVSSASNGDTILVAAGTATWTSPLTINKKVTIQGAGIGSSIIRTTAATHAFDIRISNARVTGFTLDCNSNNQSNWGIINIGPHDGTGCYYHNTIADIADWRIDHNRFLNCGRTVENMYPAIVTAGPAYGVIDNNTFETCNGECITLYQDGKNAWDRSNEPGQYSTNKTTYIEDNIFNYDAGPWAENAVDSNEGSRYVFRYNTININDADGVAGIVSGHDPCDTGDACYSDDYAGSALIEFYGNKIYNNANANDYLVHWRGGRAFVYNNTIYGGSYTNIIKAYNRRSEHRGCGFDIYSEYCHETQSGKTSEGITPNKTTLNGVLANDSSCPAMASISGFPSFGGSVLINSEQIDYSGINGAQLTPCTRGANNTTRAAHSNGTSVSLLNWGVCVYQPQQSSATYIWNNIAGGASNNNVDVLDMISGGEAPYYNQYDVQSYAQRPQNWQYRNDGMVYSYTPYPYPHPLTLGGAPDTTPPAAPSGVVVN